MFLRSMALSALATVLFGGFATSANAGPLIDWLFRGRQTQPTVPVGAPIPLGNGYGAMPGYSTGYPGYVAAYPGYSAAYPAYSTFPGGAYSAGYAPSATYIPNYGYAANLGTYYGNRLPVIGPNGAGYTAQMPTGIAAATLPQAMGPQPMSYVPNYASSALRAPVTYYRPLMTTDPNTGAQVVAMAPCTSYQYLTQRVPTFGQSALYGSYQAPQVPLQATPTYTLPSGGIPIGQSAPIANGAVLGYSPYSSYQVSPPVVMPGTSMPLGSSYHSNPIPTYHAAPTYGSTYYGNSSYGSQGGGSTGSYSQPIPGLVAPPASSAIPGTNSPSGSVYPPGSTSNFDNFNTPPSLPLEGTGALRPQLKSIVPESTRTGKESALNSSSSERTMLSEPVKDFPMSSPIPAPEGMEKPNWSPGLLRNEDMTALRPSSKSAQLAGQSKKIHWASFEQELTLSDSAGQQTSQQVPRAIDPSSPALRMNPSATLDRSSVANQGLQLGQPEAARRQSATGMVPLSTGAATTSKQTLPSASFNPNSSASPRVGTPSGGAGSYSTSGWSAGR